MAYQHSTFKELYKSTWDQKKVPLEIRTKEQAQEVIPAEFAEPSDALVMTLLNPSVPKEVLIEALTYLPPEHSVIILAPPTQQRLVEELIAKIPDKCAFMLDLTQDERLVQYDHAVAIDKALKFNTPITITRFIKDMTSKKQGSQESRLNRIFLKINDKKHLILAHKHIENDALIKLVKKVPRQSALFLAQDLSQEQMVLALTELIPGAHIYLPVGISVEQINTIALHRHMFNKIFITRTDWDDENFTRLQSHCSGKKISDWDEYCNPMKSQLQIEGV